ncbi:uncharacterized protein F5147DRAFT_655430 [Suillus discolor]|uniref:Uncharacterized protein n=1 Tax=Suillus discolor TaxID=1912936 RepID=A0A9P7JQT2_9AGAM|nr:uncharacterized protein F5147DRAFT_655430 [Suillus discolor]KAG2101101.1 hypothetical protein F5147DRAFT_655430 [Suillus discolor]
MSPSPSLRGHSHEPHNQRPLQTTNQSVFYWPDFGEASSIKDEKFPTTLHLQGDYAPLDGGIEGNKHSDLVLAAAKAKRKVCEAEKHLADCILAHQLVILNIWHQHVQAANSCLLMVELNVVCLHTERKKIGISMSMTRSHSDGTTTVGTSSSY